MKKNNVALRKTDYRYCYVCGKIRKREELKYISRFLSPYVIPACNECRTRYRNNRFLRHFVREQEFAR